VHQRGVESGPAVLAVISRGDPLQVVVFLNVYGDALVDEIHAVGRGCEGAAGVLLEQAGLFSTEVESRPEKSANAEGI